MENTVYLVVNTYNSHVVPVTAYKNKEDAVARVNKENEVKNIYDDSIWTYQALPVHDTFSRNK